MPAHDKALTTIAEGKIAALATSGPTGPEVCAVFYVLMGNRLAFKSRRSSAHMRNVRSNPIASALVYSHDSTYMSKLGVQIKGQVREVSSFDEMSALTGLYFSQFEGSANKIADIDTLTLPSTESTFFVFEMSKYRLIDEEPNGNFTMVEYASW